MLQIDASLFGEKGLFKCKLLLLLLFHYFAILPLWPDMLSLSSTEAISLLTSQPHSHLWICLIASLILFTDFVDFSFFAVVVVRMAWNILSLHLEFDLFLCSSICQLCGVDPLWIVGQSYNSYSVSWSNPISEVLCPHSCVSPVSSFDQSNRNGWHSYGAQIRLCDEVLHRVQEKIMHVLACAFTYLKGGLHFDSRCDTMCDCSVKVRKSWKHQTQLPSRCLRLWE